jgi:hypothetical protein
VTATPKATYCIPTLLALPGVSSYCRRNSLQTGALKLLQKYRRNHESPMVRGKKKKEMFRITTTYCIWAFEFALACLFQLAAALQTGEKQI